MCYLQWIHCLSAWVLKPQQVEKLKGQADYFSHVGKENEIISVFILNPKKECTRLGLHAETERTVRRYLIIVLRDYWILRNFRSMWTPWNQPNMAEFEMTLSDFNVVLKILKASWLLMRIVIDIFDRQLYLTDPSRRSLERRRYIGIRFCLDWATVNILQLRIVKINVNLLNKYANIYHECLHNIIGW